MAHKINKDLHRRTAGEAFWLARIDYNVTQAQAANHYGWSERRYWEIETDRRKPLGGNPLSRPYSTGVLCALARRRHGKTLRDTATLLGYSHVTILAWEKSSDPRLVKAWKGLGYRF